MKKVRVATYLANALDHFDTSLYGFLVPIIAPLFFPSSDPVTALIKGYALVIIGFITRPLGAWYFSKKADTVGPHQTLIITIMGMTITTFCFTLIQPYNNWGIFGAICLCVLRGMQNFFGAGETSIASLYVLENAETNKQYSITSLYLSSTMVGILLACFVTSILFYSNNPQLYWKLPFYGSLITGLTGWYLRYQYNPTFVKKKIFQKQINWQDIIKLIPITGLSYILYSAPMVFFNSFAPIVTNISIKTLMASNTILMFFDLVLLTIFGSITRNINPKQLLLKISGIIIIIFPILFLIIPFVNLFGAIVIRIIMITLGVAFCIPLNRWYYEELGEHNRYTVTSIGYAIGSEILGRSFPMVGLLLWQISNLAIIPGLYIALISLWAFYNIKINYKI